MEEDFMVSLTTLSNYLRGQVNFARELGKCPRCVETRWTSFEKALKWLIRNRVEVINFLEQKNSVAKPSVYFSIMIFVVKCYMDSVSTSFSKAIRDGNVAFRTENELTR